MELRQLKYFLTVADTRNFVSAASRLFISRQAVSKAISQLEDELNTELFLRNSSGAFLTPAGVMFYERVRNIVLDLDHLCSEMQEQSRHYHQRVRLAFAPGVLPAYEGALCTFAAQQTNIDILYDEFSAGECLARLNTREADLVVTSVYANDSTTGSWSVRSVPLGLLAADDSTDAWDDPRTTFACPEDAQLRRVFERAGKPVRYCGYDRARLFDLAAAGHCRVLLPQLMQPAAARGLVWTPQPQLPAWRLYCSYLRSNEKNDLYRTVLDALLWQVFGVSTA